VYLIGFVLMIAALVGLVPLTTMWTLYAFSIVFGLAYGGLAAAHSPLVAWLFGMRQHGLIFGVTFNGWTLGCALGPIFAGYVFDSTGSYQAAFLVCAALAAVGLVLTAMLTPIALEAPAAPPAPKLGSVPA
jgi:MFS transporter, OFA family, oxalate/formate antiporter